jgi:hypothetical protein
MESKLDKIKSTITISLGTKNRLRELKGGQSYEEYINYLIRLRNKQTHGKENLIEFQKFNRKKGIFSFDKFKILFEYNEYNGSNNFTFDLSIGTVRKSGKKTSFQNYLNELDKNEKKVSLTIEYKTYFELLQIAIQKEIDKLFKHKGRFEDHFSWKQEFRILNLPKKSLNEDVIEKLNSYEHGQSEL